MAIPNLIVRNQLGMGLGSIQYMMTRGLGAFGSGVGTVMRGMRRLRARSIAVLRAKGYR